MLPYALADGEHFPMSPRHSTRALRLSCVSALALLPACTGPDTGSDPDPASVDADGDGVLSDTDCDDTRAWVFPGAPEACDGLDTDCDPSTGEDGTVLLEEIGGFDSPATALAHGGGTALIVCTGTYVGALHFPEGGELSAATGAEVVLEGDGLEAVITVSSGSFLLDGVVVRGGGGEAVEVDGELLTVGGGLSAWGAESVLVRHTAFEDNTADLGGHLAGPLEGTLSVEQTVLIGGTAVIAGGAIYTSSGTLSLVEVELDGNQAPSGGAVAVEGGSLEWREGRAHGNTASDGGALAAWGADSLTLTGVELADNLAEEAGGAAWFSDCTSVAVETSMFRANRGGEGGAISAREVGTLELIESIFEANDAGLREGGALRLHAVDDGRLSDVSAIENLASHGGAISASDMIDLDMQDVTLEGNEAKGGYGGGGTFSQIERLEMRRTNAIGNRAFRGGGLRFYADPEDFIISSVTLEEVEVGQNSSDDHGGGIHAGHITELTLLDSVVYGNDTAATAGGGLFLRENGHVGLTASTVTANTVAGDGAGIYATGTGVETMSISGHLSSNVSVGGYGGGLAAFDIDQVSIHDAEISDNTAELGGGAWLSGSSLSASDTDWAGDDSDNDPDDVATPDASHVDVGSTFSCDPDGVCG